MYGSVTTICGRAREVGAEQRIVGDAALVLLEGEVLFLEDEARPALRRFAMDLGARPVAQLPDFPVFALGDGLVVVAGVLLFLQRLDRLGPAVCVVIAEVDGAVGGVDAQDLVLDALAALDRRSAASPRSPPSSLRRAGRGSSSARRRSCGCRRGRGSRCRTTSVKCSW